jgi:hypothetical protein
VSITTALAPLTAPVVVGGELIGKVMQSLVVYLVGPTVEEFEALIDLYEALCPPPLRTRYKTAEIDLWFPVAAPELTIGGRAAAARGAARPYTEPVRERIRDGRAFEFQLWDGHELNDPVESWSFSCRCIHLRTSGLHAFARFLIPLATDTLLLSRAARIIASRIDLHSGHCGPVFVYDPWNQGPALDAAYAIARRFWGMDLEDRNATLPLMTSYIKGVSWITLVGRAFRSRPEIAAALRGLEGVDEVDVEHLARATVLTAGAQPTAGDQYRPDPSLGAYEAVADALRPLMLEAHPDFPSQRFIENGNTVGWFRRFIEPAGWR